MFPTKSTNAENLVQGRDFPTPPIGAENPGKILGQTRAARAPCNYCVPHSLLPRPWHEWLVCARSLSSVSSRAWSDFVSTCNFFRQIIRLQAENKRLREITHNGWIKMIIFPVRTGDEKILAFQIIPRKKAPFSQGSLEQKIIEGKKANEKFFFNRANCIV